MLCPNLDNIDRAKGHRKMSPVGLSIYRKVDLVSGQVSQIPGILSTVPAAIKPAGPRLRRGSNSPKGLERSLGEGRRGTGKKVTLPKEKLLSMNSSTY